MARILITGGAGLIGSPPFGRLPPPGGDGLFLGKLPTRPPPHPPHPLPGPPLPFPPPERAPPNYPEGPPRPHGVETRIVRIFNPHGPPMRLNDGRVVPNSISQALRDEPLTVYGDGSQTRSFCYVSDLVEGLVRLLRSDHSEPVNCGNPMEISILQFAERIKALTGSKSEIVFRPLPEDDPRVRQPDITKARTLLGWEPRVALEDGLRRTIDFFRPVVRKA